MPATSNPKFTSWLGIFRCILTVQIRAHLIRQGAKNQKAENHKSQRSRGFPSGTGWPAVLDLREGSHTWPDFIQKVGTRLEWEIVDRGGGKEGVKNLHQVRRKALRKGNLEGPRRDANILASLKSRPLETVPNSLVSSIGALREI